MDNSPDHSRVIGFIDMDSFEVQIYLKRVYTKWRVLYKIRPIILSDGERIVSVNAMAKDLGISRDITVTAAKRIYPDVLIMKKEKRFNKPESLYLRESSWAVLDAIVEYRENHIQSQDRTMKLEYSPSDEFFLDMTEEVDYQCRNSVEIEYPSSDFNLESTEEYSNINELDHNYLPDFNREGPSLKYLRGLVILEKISEAILDKTGFECSVGISENKLLAKLACTLHKPNGMTIMTHDGFCRVASSSTIDKLKGLGGDLGTLIIQTLNESNPMKIDNLRCLDEVDLLKHLSIDKDEARFVFERVRGICTDPVIEKLMTNTITVAKANYRNPRLFIHQHGCVEEALKFLCDELFEKLEEDFQRHGRHAESIQVHVWIANKKATKGHFTVKIPYHDHLECCCWEICDKKLSDDTFLLFKERFKGWKGPIEKISLTAKPKVDDSKCPSSDHKAHKAED